MIWCVEQKTFLSFRLSMVQKDIWKRAFFIGLIFNDSSFKVQVKFETKKHKIALTFLGDAIQNSSSFNFTTNSRYILIV